MFSRCPCRCSHRSGLKGGLTHPSGEWSPRDAPRTQGLWTPPLFLYCLLFLCLLEDHRNPQDASRPGRFVGRERVLPPQVPFRTHVFLPSPGSLSISLLLALGAPNWLTLESHDPKYPHPHVHLLIAKTGNAVRFVRTGFQRFPLVLTSKVVSILVLLWRVFGDELWMVTRGGGGGGLHWSAAELATRNRRRKVPSVLSFCFRVFFVLWCVSWRVLERELSICWYFLSGLAFMASLLGFLYRIAGKIAAVFGLFPFLPSVAPSCLSFFFVFYFSHFFLFFCFFSFL